MHKHKEALGCARIGWRQHGWAQAAGKPLGNVKPLLSVPGAYCRGEKLETGIFQEKTMPEFSPVEQLDAQPRLPPPEEPCDPAVMPRAELKTQKVTGGE